ncbi:hypothetical protein LBMAG41_07620 [Cyanobium sp.]|nr:hypothetical protein LBMAG41_07620 [Cyanobium sp.]
MLALGFFGASAIPMAARAADPRARVICDAPRPVCFDRQGPFIGLTRTYYGPGASNRLLGQLSRSPPQRKFQLSSGQLCDLIQQLCWDGGWRRRNVNPLLNRQLFLRAVTLHGPLPWARLRHPSRPLRGSGSASRCNAG